MNLMAGILMFPVRRILFAIGVPVALVELYLGVNLMLCFMSVMAIALIPPWILDWGLGWLARKRLSFATPALRDLPRFVPDKEL